MVLADQAHLASAFASLLDWALITGLGFLASGGEGSMMYSLQGRGALGKAHLLLLIKLFPQTFHFSFLKEDLFLTIRLCLKQGSLPLIVRHLYWLARNAECEATGLGESGHDFF